MKRIVSHLWADRNARAWLFLVSAVALHVADETLTGFLPWYNQLVLEVRGQVGFFPLPTFPFRAWLGGLIIAVCIGYGLTIPVMRGGRVIRVVTTALGVLMIANALGHLGGSLYIGRRLPGSLSSPILLIAAVLVVRNGLMGSWRQRKDRQ